MDFRNAIAALLHANPLDSCIDANERVVFFPTAAALDGDGRWRIPIHGWIYRPTEFSRLRRAGLWFVKRLLRRRIPADHPGLPVFERRAGAFLADNERGSRVRIRLGDADFTLKRSRGNGHFDGVLKLPAGQVERLLAAGAAPDESGWLSFRAITRSSDARLFDGRVLLLPPTGLSVISDIDDTIKVTEVLRRREMLRNTFLKDFTCVPEMARLYRRWETERGAAFHYVSASPWHLFPFLAEFMKAQQFPAGTFHLRDFRLMPRDLRKTLRSSRRVKLKHIRRLLKQFPGRRFLLVGDSGESDATLYASLARQFPRQVEKIFIRNVTDDPPESPRWKKTFARLPEAQYMVFSDPTKIA